MSYSLSVRNIEDDVVVRLKQRAMAHGRSTEAEMRAILRDAVRTEVPDDFADLAAKLRAMTAGRAHTPAEILLREDREAR